MKKHILSAAALLFTTMLFAQQKGMVVIKGTLNGDLKGYNEIYMYTRTSNDSVKIDKGHYTFTFPFTGVGMKFLYPKYIKEMHMMYQPFGILITEPGTYYVVSDIAKGMPASALKGPESMVLYHKYEEEEREAYKESNEVLSKLYGEKWWSVDEKDSNYSNIHTSTDSLHTAFVFPLIRNMVKEHPDSYSSPYILLNSGREVGTLEEKEEAYEMLSAKMKKSDAGTKFKDYLEGLKSSSVGGVVTDFTLPDPAGEDLDFKNLKGKYVLIDFWASWCYPCRQSFPYMRKMYEKYKGDKFEIYSISIDEDKSAWLKAVKEEKNPWLQALDTKNISQKGFAVTAIPATFLLDPTGKILVKEVGFETDGTDNIEKKVKELFPDKNSGKHPATIPMTKMN